MTVGSVTILTGEGVRTGSSAHSPPGSGSFKTNHPQTQRVKARGDLFLLAYPQVAGTALPQAAAPGTLFHLEQVG